MASGVAAPALIAPIVGQWAVASRWAVAPAAPGAVVGGGSRALVGRRLLPIRRSAAASSAAGGRLAAVSATPAGVSDVASIQAAVLTWYASNGRSLNFRRRRDAYSVLVSETMAQQTQISRVEPAWEAFLARFPTVQALAAAPPADVLRAWQGMGYNRRALNLQRAARMIVATFGGVVPGSVEALERLPGVGPYTARAVAAIAFGQPVGAVDTNVRRVLGRVGGGWSGIAARELQALADAVVPAGRAGEWTHALMDIGARYCRPHVPACPDCPVRAHCIAAGEAAPGPSRPAVDGHRQGLPTAGRTAGRAVGRAVPSRRVPFRETSRWLRGRIVDRARAAEADDWVRIDGPWESHAETAVHLAVRGLAAEGLLEIHPTDPALMRLPR